MNEGMRFTQPSSLFRAPVEGDTLRRVVVLESELEYRTDVDGEGDWYVVWTRTRAEMPSLNDLPKAATSE